MKDPLRAARRIVAPLAAAPDPAALPGVGRLSFAALIAVRSAARTEGRAYRAVTGLAGGETVIVGFAPE